MTKIKKLMCAVFAAMLIFSCFPTVSFAEMSGDFVYKILDDGTAEITDYNGSAAELTVPSTIDGFTVTSIGDIAFRSNSALTSVIIPDSVMTIGSLAFSCCVSLTTATIGRGVTTIGYCAFEYCIALTSVTIGSGVTSIGYGAFDDCGSLTSVTIPVSSVRIAAL